MDYKKAGVDIEAGYKSVELMKKHVAATMRPEVLGGLGGFSGTFSLAKIKEMEDPVLLSGTDGCGTKVKLAVIMDRHDTIGIDAVAMCVNDIACAGGEPLFFLDYIACGKNVPEKIADIVRGVAQGCVQSEAALIGGETAEHPGLMPEEDYDLAGFAVGVCDRKDMITGETLKDGDVLIGMASSGVHSNGFSLVRKVFEKELTREDFLYAFQEKPLKSYNGYYLRAEIRPFTGFPSERRKSDYSFSEKNAVYLEKIADLCRENGVELALMKGPGMYPEWGEPYEEQIREFADERGLVYMNTLLHMEEIGLDLSEDTYDEGLHLNVYGAEKLSVWLGKQLKEQYDFTDFREQEKLAKAYGHRLEEYRREIEEQKEEFERLGYIRKFR